MARLWSIRKSSEKLASFSGEAGEASFSELFGVIEQSFLELFGAFPVIERTLTREVFQENLEFRLVTWWGGSPWVERLPHQNSAAEPQYPPRYGPSKF